ncbi:hypothetical protein JRO89_XS10G0013400 [Xanthoceras sorbifolium]|uniref:Uncharacterized protein n=1 Tax=Xanthoceras sorbifolium TaxID=99658 RepID=A0ABQ8HH86_9ROSI|nr:hypothetical protein JRO89_XS10G0013400 [Xanthoceras sorbifolium]
MKATEIPIKTKTTTTTSSQMKIEKTQKPPFRPAQDDTKPAFQDPILRSDPIETEEAVLRLPPFSINKSKFQSSS